MTTEWVLALTIGALFSVGVYLMLSRNLIRVLLGFLLIGHGTNLLLLSAGSWGTPPVVGEPGSVGAAGSTADPLPQAFILTSIVITLAVTCFLLAVVYRNYRLTRQAELGDDPDDVLAGSQPGGAE